jgi:hypothetical protein
MINFSHNTHHRNIMIRMQKYIWTILYFVIFFFVEWFENFAYS